jgi:hypothetical protein
MDVKAYLKITKRNDSFLTEPVIDEIVDFANALKDKRLSMDSVKNFINDFLQSKEVRHDMNRDDPFIYDMDPDRSLEKEYCRVLYNYFKRLYSDRTSKTIPDAFAYSTLRQWYNRLGFADYESLNDVIDIDEFDIDEACRNDDSLPQKITFTPIKAIDFDILYNYLINNGVIKYIFLNDFKNLILNADLLNLFKTGKKAKLKCTVKILKSYFMEPWFESVCTRLGKSKEDMGKYRITDDFESKFPNFHLKP